MSVHARILLLVFCIAAVSVCSSCTSLALHEYRDDALLDRYEYALGEEYLEVNGLRLCYQETGRGETVLILPGVGTSIDFWQFNIPALAEGNHVVALDYPGVGKSDKPNVDYELPWIVEQIVAFMDAKGIERATIVGGSAGGHLALLLALKYPERVTKLVLMGSVGTWAPPGLWMELGFKTLWWDATVIDVLRRRWPEIYDKVFKRETAFTRSLFLYNMALRANGARFRPYGRAASRILVSVFYNSCRYRLGEIPCPALLVWGQEDQIHTVEEVAMYFREHLPDSRLVVVPDAAHEVMVDQPEVFNGVVSTFLKSGTDAVADRIPGMFRYPDSFDLVRVQRLARERGS